jgi:beta-N-acetylhexosaminidase
MPTISRRITAVAVIILVALILSQCAGIPLNTPSSTISAPDTPAIDRTENPTLMPAFTSSPLPAPTSSPSPTPTPQPTPMPDPVLEIISGMSDEELLGQMVMLGFAGRGGMPKDTAMMYSKYKVGGVMLFGWNVGTFDQTKKLVDAINENNPYPDLPLFIGIDEEGGIVHRLPWSPPTRSAATLGKRNNPDAVYSQFLRVGSKLRELGINIDFAPVLDIAPQLTGTFLGNRMYGTDPDKVIPLVEAAIRGLHDGGIFSLGKHFPGHGNTASDSHKNLPRMGDSLDRLRDYTLKPFAAAVAAGVDAMLVGHLLVPALDSDNPASLSRKVITGLLREEMGFKGVIFSDDMRMGAIVANYDIGEACVRFVEAGGDVVFIGKYVDKQKKALEALDKAVKSGRISRARLLESVYRIVSLKLRLKASFSPS